MTRVKWRHDKIATRVNTTLPIVASEIILQDILPNGLKRTLAYSPFKRPTTLKMRHNTLKNNDDIPDTRPRGLYTTVGYGFVSEPICEYKAPPLSIAPTHNISSFSLVVPCLLSCVTSVRNGSSFRVLL